VEFYSITTRLEHSQQFKEDLAKLLNSADNGDLPITDPEVPLSKLIRHINSLQKVSSCNRSFCFPKSRLVRKEHFNIHCNDFVLSVDASYCILHCSDDSSLDLLVAR